MSNSTYITDLWINYDCKVYKKSFKSTCGSIWNAYKLALSQLNDNERHFVVAYTISKIGLALNSLSNEVFEIKYNKTVDGNNV